MFDKKEVADILGIALQNGGEFADVFIEHKATNSITCEENKIEDINSGIDFGAGIRVISGMTTAYAYTNDLSLGNLKQVALTVSKAVQSQKHTLQLDLRHLKPGYHLPVEMMPEQVKIREKVEQVKLANEVARAVDGRIHQVMVGFGDVVQNILIANSEGHWVEDERVRSRFTVQTIASQGNKMQTGYESYGGFMGSELFKQRSPEDIAREASRRALLMLDAKPAPVGKMMVVMDSVAGGTMVHEACGHGLEADLVQKGVSIYAGKKGQKVASSLVTVVDDGTIPQRYGSYHFDDEGIMGQKNILIRNGILEGYMYDRMTARQDNVRPTGNGRRQSFQYRPIPRMTNTSIAPGEMDPKEIVKATSKGILVKKMGGGQVNTVNGDFVFEVSEGYLIENGEITVPVRGATLTGNGPKVLQKIDMVGNDSGFFIGTCGKDGQGVPVSASQPTMRITEMLVGGTEQ